MCRGYLSTCSHSHFLSVPLLRFACTHLFTYVPPMQHPTLIFLTHPKKVHTFILKLLIIGHGFISLFALAKSQVVAKAITTRWRLCTCCLRPDCGAFEDRLGGKARQEMFKNGLSSSGTCLMPSPASVRMTRTTARNCRREFAAGDE